MGLAPYGKPKYLDALRDVLKLEKNGAFKLNLNYFKSSDISRLRAQDILIDADNKGKWKRRCPV